MTSSEHPTGTPHPTATPAAHTVTILTRATCGSCQRVREQITPICAEYGVPLVTLDVDSDPDTAAEFGDRVPVILVDDDEIACWEIDNEDLIAALTAG